jgi:hypothetical protein
MVKYDHTTVVRDVGVPEHAYLNPVVRRVSRRARGVEPELVHPDPAGSTGDELAARQMVSTGGLRRCDPRKQVPTRLPAERFGLEKSPPSEVQRRIGEAIDSSPSLADGEGALDGPHPARFS